MSSHNDKRAKAEAKDRHTPCREEKEYSIYMDMQIHTHQHTMNKREQGTWLKTVMKPKQGQDSNRTQKREGSIYTQKEGSIYTWGLSLVITSNLMRRGGKPIKCKRRVAGAEQHAIHCCDEK